MSKEGERGTGPQGDSKGGIPGPSGAGQSDAGATAVGQGIMVDANILASILSQARGPILNFSSPPVISLCR